MRPPSKYAALAAEDAHHMAVAVIRGPEAPPTWLCPVCGLLVQRVNLMFEPDAWRRTELYRQARPQR